MAPIQRIVVESDEHNQDLSWIYTLALLASLRESEIAVTHLIKPSHTEVVYPSYIAIAPEQWHWLLSLGIDEAKALDLADGVFCLGWQYQADARPTSFCSYSPLLASVEGLSGSQLFIAHSRMNESKTHRPNATLMSLNGHCYQQNRFSHPLNKPSHPLSALEYGVKVNRVGFYSYIKTLCLEKLENTPSPSGQTLQIKLKGPTYTDGISTQHRQASATPSSTLATELSVSQTSGMHITCQGRSHASEYSLSYNALSELLHKVDVCHVEQYQMSFPLPSARLALPDLGISTVQQLIQTSLAFFPSQHGWHSQTQRTLKAELTHIATITRDRAALLLWPILVEQQQRPNPAKLIDYFVLTGTVEHNASALFDSALTENLLLSMGIMPDQSHFILANISGETISHIINTLKERFSLVTQKLASHDDYLAHYLRENTCQ